MRKWLFFYFLQENNVDKNTMGLYYNNVNDNEYQYKKKIYISKLRRIK